MAAFSGADLADEWAGSLPCAWPVTGDCQHSPAPAFEHGQGALRGGRRRGRRRREPCAREGRRRARRGRLRAAPGCHRRREALSDSAPLVHDEYEENRAYTWTLETGEIDRLFSEARGHRQGALPAAAADPERDRAAERARAAGARDGRVHDVVGDAGPAHRAGDPLRNDGDPGDQAPGHRARRRRWVRLEAERLRGGGAVSRARTAARASDQVDGGALRGLRGDHPRPRRPAGDRARGDRGGEDHRRPRAADGRRWAPTCSSSRPGSRSSAPGSTRGATTCRRTTSSASASSRTRLRQTPIAARAARRRRMRSSGRWTRSRASWTWIRSSSGARTSSPSFPTAIASGLEIDSGDFHASLDKALELVDYDGFRRDQAERRGRGDPKQIGIGFSTYVEMCGLAPSRILGAIRYGAGGWDAATIRCLPTGTVQVLIGTSPHGQGHVDDVLADRRRPARGPDRERRGAPRRHHGDPARDGHVREPQPRRRRRRPLPRHREGDREGAEDRRPPARGGRGRPRVRERTLHGHGHRQVDDGHGRRPVRLDGPQPARRARAGPRGHVRLRPAQLQLAGRLPHRDRRDRHRDRATSTSSATSPSTTSAP